MLQSRPLTPRKSRVSSAHGILKSPGVMRAKMLKRTSILSVKNKSIWPELVGMAGHEARRRIKEEIPLVQAHIISRNDMITEEYMPARVQLFVDENGKVIWPPQIG
jgi:hypothetical protein